LITVLLISIITIAIPVSAVATTWYVDGTLGDDTVDQGTGTGLDAFATIQYAIDDTDVADGDTIIVATGTYTENIVVDKSLTLLGDVLDPASVIVENTPPPTDILSVFSISADNVEISGFTVTGAIYWEPLPAPAAIYIDADVSGTTISHNDITGNYNGIYMAKGSHHNTVTDNDVSANYQGVEMSLSSHNTFTRNLVDNNEHCGFYIESSQYNTFEKNIVTNNPEKGFFMTVGPYWPDEAPVADPDYTGNNYNTFTENTVTGTDCGIKIFGGTGNTFTRNTITASIDGMLLLDQEIGSGDDIYTSHTTDLTMNENTITGSTTGIKIDVSVDDVTSWEINYNDIHTNTLGIEYLGTDTLDATLNYWGADVTEAEIEALVGLYVDYDPWLTYSFDLPNVDSFFYRTGDTVTVTICDSSKNYDPLRTETIPSLTDPALIHVVSTTDTAGFDMVLTETGQNTGLFMGSFPLVEPVEPGALELGVNDGDTIYVGEKSQAIVDDTDPVVEITAPLDEAFVKGTVGFTADIDDINEDTTVLKINDVDTLDGLAYEWDTTTVVEGPPVVPDWPDGLYTIEVIVTDFVGNIGSDLITVTVDNTKPVIANELVSPATVYPSTAATFVFTAEVSDVTSGVDTVTIDLRTIGGGSAVSMLDDGVDPDVTADDGVYTTSYETTGLSKGQYAVTITAKDKAGNEFTPIAPLTIVSSTDLVKPVISGESITYPLGVVSARLGDPLVISATVTDDIEVDTVTVSDALVSHVLTAVSMLDPEEDDTYSVTIDPLETFVSGSYVLTITATDINGNIETATVILEVTTKLTGYYVDLEEGWNLFSLPLMPDDSSVEVVLADVMENVEIVWGYKDDAWSSYLPAVPEFKTLTDMVDGEGYWVKMTAEDTVTVSGVELPGPGILPPVYDVYEGWNLIGFKEVDSMEVTENLAYFTTIPKLVRDSSVCYSWDATLQEYEMAYIAGTQLIAFDPGQGYWLYLTEDANIVP